MFKHIRSFMIRRSARTAHPLFELIKAEVTRNPNASIDESAFPEIRLTDGDAFTFAAGAMDALGMGHSKAKQGIHTVRDIISNIDIGKIVEWQQVESSLKGFSAINAVDEVLDGLAGSVVTFKAVRLFWMAAKQSSDYEVVKWGIILGSLDEREEKLDDLLTFARHPEFTRYCSLAIRRMAVSDSKLARYLVQLLPLSRQWGVISLIQHIVLEKQLIQDREVQRNVLIYGMKNNDGIPMEVAFTIAENIDIYFFLNLGETDTAVYVALSALMDTLITQPNPLGGINQLPDGAKLIAAYVRMLNKRPTDMRMLDAFYIIEEYLTERGQLGKEESDLLSDVRRSAKERLEDNVLRAGLNDEPTRWLTLNLIKRLKATSLLPEVREAFLKNPDYAAINILVEIGTREDLQRLFSAIPKLVNLQDRARRKMSPVNVHGPEHKGAFEYSQIVEALGLLATSEAIAHIKSAVNDYDPLIRQSACKAVEKLPSDKLDKEITKLIRERLDDPMAYVREAARQALAKIPV